MVPVYSKADHQENQIRIVSNQNNDGMEICVRMPDRNRGGNGNFNGFSEY